MLAARDKDAEALAALLDRLAAAPRSRYGAGRGELAAYAPLSGGDFAAEVETHPPFGRFQLQPEPLIRAGLASAAVPRPTPIAWTRADLDAEAQLGARALRRTGLAGRGRSSDCLEGGLVTPGTLAITDALDALDALALPVGPVTAAPALQRAAEVWEIVRPDTLIVDATSLAFLHGADAYPRPRAFAVLLTPANAAELAAPARADLYRILSVPQVCTFVAGECAAHDGFHVAEDAVLAEIVDDAAAPLRDGGVGHLLLTTLTRSLALVRFDSGLRATLDRSPCRCGETHARLRVAA
jgi:phenylacetate-CoA ligase